MHNGNKFSIPIQTLVKRSTDEELWSQRSCSVGTYRRGLLELTATLIPFGISRFEEMPSRWTASQRGGETKVIKPRGVLDNLTHVRRPRLGTSVSFSFWIRAGASATSSALSRAVQRAEHRTRDEPVEALLRAMKTRCKDIMHTTSRTRKYVRMLFGTKMQIGRWSKWYGGGGSRAERVVNFLRRFSGQRRMIQRVSWTGHYYRNYYCRLRRLSSAFLTRCVKFISRTIILRFMFDFDLKASAQ